MKKIFNKKGCMNVTECPNNFEYNYYSLSCCNNTDLCNFGQSYYHFNDYFILIANLMFIFGNFLLNQNNKQEKQNRLILNFMY